MSKKSRWIILVGISLLIVAVAARFFLKTVNEGDTIKLNYTLMLDDGTVYYTTAKNAPLHVTLGKGMLLPSFEEALIGMHRGETRFLTIPAEQAYGAYRTDLIQVVERDQFPDGAQPALGQQFDAELLDGSPTLAVITAVTDTTVTLDANHPLAGQNLNFEINVVSIEKPVGTANPMGIIIGWTLLLVGVGVGRFAFFSARNRSIRWPGLVRRTAFTGYRKR